MIGNLSFEENHSKMFQNMEVKCTIRNSRQQELRSVCMLQLSPRQSSAHTGVWLGMCPWEVTEVKNSSVSAGRVKKEGANSQGNRPDCGY